MKVDLTTLIRNAVSQDSPDLHLRVGQPPIVRLSNGELSAFQEVDPLTKADIEEIIASIANPAQQEAFRNDYQVDFSYHIEGLSRFRINLFQEQGGPAISLRIIPSHIPSLQEIGLGEVAQSLAMLPNGLVLVTGATGSGKSTTLAALLDYINQNRNCHIITIEDPIEYTYRSKRSLITQRELNAHTKSFSQAIRGALRQDPDVVMVGEMRDLETISAAITLAETGHLVLSTLHTRDAVQTVDRIIDVFPANQQGQIRAQLSSGLKGVISQALVPRSDGKSGRVAAREVMLVNDAVRNCILSGQTNQIYSIIQINGAQGMQLMDRSLEDLFRQGLISQEQAFAHATDLESLQQRIG